MKNSFYLLQSIFGTRRRRQRVGRRPIQKSTLGGFEALESRQMLTSHALATVTGVVGTTESEVSLTVADNDQPVVLGIMVSSGEGSALDPQAPRVVAADSTPDPQVVQSTDNHNGTTSGFATMQFAAGEYKIHVSGEADTAGAFVLDVTMPGDAGHDGGVGQDELQWTVAAMLQQQDWGNHFSSRMFRVLGVDTTVDLYQTELDANLDGIIDGSDIVQVTQNSQAGSVTVNLTADADAPVIAAALEQAGDTGRSDSDGITNDTDARITGTITDAGQIATFSAQIDGGAVEDLLTLLGQDFITDGTFELDLDDLGAIAGGTRDDLIDSGAHTLKLNAADSLGNETQTAVEVTFEFDTVAPDPPSLPGLVAASDSGFSDSDNVTNVNTPTFEIEHADANVFVQLFSDLALDPLGEATTASTVTITSTQLDDGEHQITAKGTDVAGNESDASAALTVTIDTDDPVAPQFDLDAGSDTGTVGDGFTSQTLVSLSGTGEGNATVRVDGTSRSAVAAAGGSFTITNVELVFGSADYTLTATDAAGNSSQATESFTLNNAPVVEDQSFSVNENRQGAFVIGIVVATDANLSENDSLSYEIIGGTGTAAFEINQVNGALAVSDPALIDFETLGGPYTLTVQVTDQGGDGQGGVGLSDTAAMTITVNDVEPAIANQTVGAVDETAVNGTSVGTVTVTGDTNSLDFTLTADPSGGGFAVNGTTGEITVADTTKINFEQDTSFGLTVQVSDDGGVTTDNAVVTVDVTDVKPAIADQTLGAVDETAAVGTVVGTVTITGDTVPVTYSITNDPTNGGFGIDSGTGTITVADTAKIDFEQNASVGLTVGVTDGTVPGTDTATVTIEITDIEPAIADQALPDIAETAANGTPVGTVAITGDTVPVTYTITNDPTLGGFAIDSGTGAITVADTTKIDHEQLATVGLTVQVSDGTGAAADTAIVTINVTDVEPAIADQSVGPVDEDAADDTPVGTVAITGDTNSVVYAIETDPSGGAFGIDSATGEINVANTSLIDFEQDVSFVLEVSVTDDSGITTDSAQVTIAINDIAPAIADQTVGSVDETAANGASVGTVVTTGDDNSLTYSIDTDPSNGGFTIDGSTGEISVADTTLIDFEQNTSFDLTVQVTDGTTPVSATVTVTVNDIEPVIDDQTLTPVDETAANGTSAGTVAITGDLEPVTYTITNDPSGGGFTIDPATGEITVADNTLLDHEQADSVILTVQVSDGTGTTHDTALVTIGILDVDEPPAFEDQTFPVRLNGGTNVEVGTIDAGDPEGLAVTFAVTGGTGLALFSVHPTTGVITAPDTADTVLGEQDYTLNIDVAEVGGLTQTTSATVTIQARFNQNPVATDDAYDADENGDVSGNAITDDTGAGVDSDPDTDPLTFAGFDVTGTSGTVADNGSGGFTYNPNGQFESLAINGTDTDTFDYTITDGLGGSDTGTVTITIHGENDAPEANPVAANANEDGLTVDGSFDADDVDTDDGPGDLTYAITSAPTEGSVINNNDGTFTFDPGSDFQDLGNGETRDVSFTYTAKDSHNAVSDPATVTVTVTGVNDDPTFAEIQTVTLKVGSPLHIPLDGFDDEGQALTYAVTGNTNSAAVAASLPETLSQGMRVVVPEFGAASGEDGVMVFKLFEQRVPDITDRIIAVANADSYDGSTFDTVVDALKIQGGMVADGSEATWTEIDDQFHEDLQHNRTGMLSMYKVGDPNDFMHFDDTNTTRFFVTEIDTAADADSEGKSRREDFNTSVFGILIEGEDVRERISNVATTGSNAPQTPVVVQSVEIITDTENDVLMLKAADGATGSSDITVQVTDSQGNTFSRTFQVNIVADNFNSTPFLAPIPPISTTPGTTTAVFTLSATDVESDAVLFDAIDHDDFPDVNVSATGATVTATAPDGTTGTFKIIVGVRADDFGADVVDPDHDAFLYDLQIVTITIV